MITLVQVDAPTESFIAALGRLGQTVHAMPTAWFLSAALAPGQVLTALQPTLGPGARLLVVKTGNAAAAAGMEPAVAAWLNDAFATTYTEQVDPVSPSV